MPDLELAIITADLCQQPDVLYNTITLNGVCERSLREQADKILPYINSNDLEKELIARGEYNNNDSTKEEYKDALEAIKEIADMAI